jgi:hypothetical protein
VRKTNPLKFKGDIGAGEGDRTLDPDLGKEPNGWGEIA